MEKEKFNIKNSLKNLKTIINWFEKQEEMDVEGALEKVKQGAAIIKESRKELKKLENEFERVKKDLGEEEKTGEDINGDF